MMSHYLTIYEIVCRFQCAQRFLIKSSNYWGIFLADNHGGDALHVLQSIRVKVHQELPHPGPHGWEGKLDRHFLAWSYITTETEKRRWLLFYYAVEVPSWTKVFDKLFLNWKCLDPLCFWASNRETLFGDQTCFNSCWILRQSPAFILECVIYAAKQGVCIVPVNSLHMPPSEVGWLITYLTWISVADSSPAPSTVKTPPFSGTGRGLVKEM